MGWFDEIARGLGTANAPFGFAPVSPSQGAVDPAYNSGMQMIGNIGMGMLASGTRNPVQALGRSYLVAQNQAQEKNKQDAVAAAMLQSAEEKKQKQAEEQAQKDQFEAYVKTLPPQQQALARLYPEKFGAAVINQQFPDAQGGGASVYGNVYFDENGKPYALSKNGNFVQPGGLPPGTNLMDPEAISEARARGSMSGNAPKVIIDEYAKNIRPEMANLADTVAVLDQAKTYLQKGIQTGSNADKIQALRSLGAQLGFNVDEQVLANTQSYQNFIGNVVIPRMKELGGNDSNEELAKLYSLSGGDINQSLPALANTLDFIEKLQRRKFARLKASEDVAIKYIPGLAPIDLGGFNAPAQSGAGDLPDVSTMTDEQLRALANGQ